MRAVLSIFLTIFSTHAVALHGVDFSKCFRKAFNETLQSEYQGRKGYCSQLSEKDYKKIVSAYSDFYQGEVYPADSEDMLEAVIADMIIQISKKVSCYSNQYANLMSDQILVENTTIVEKAFLNMLKPEAINEKVFSMKLKTFDNLNSYCRSK